jgi:hypothetical protein
MARLILVTVCLAATGHARAADPLRSEPEWLVGEWKAVRKERDPRPAVTWHFRPDGTATVTQGEQTRKGTYTINFVKDALEFREEREDGTTAVESFTFFFVDRDRLLLYADTEWHGQQFRLNRPQLAE